MPDVQITITNLPQIKAAFSKAPTDMIKELNKAIGLTILDIKRQEVIEYKNYGIQVITGGLINSIQRGYYQTDLRGEVGPNVTGSPGVDYAGYVEGGTNKMQARPFLHAAISDVDERKDEYFKNAVQNVLDSIGEFV